MLHSQCANKAQKVQGEATTGETHVLQQASVGIESRQTVNAVCTGIEHARHKAAAHSLAGYILHHGRAMLHSRCANKAQKV